MAEWTPPFAPTVKCWRCGNDRAIDSFCSCMSDDEVAASYALLDAVMSPERRELSDVVSADMARDGVSYVVSTPEGLTHHVAEPEPRGALDRQRFRDGVKRLAERFGVVSLPPRWRASVKPDTVIPVRVDPDLAAYLARTHGPGRR